jgi:intracellular septation protein
MQTEQEPTSPPPSKLLVDFGPLALFFATNYFKGIFWATGVFMVAITAALFYSWKKEHKLPPMMVFTAVLVLVFGGLTIYLQDETFIKIKVTLINTLFAGILLVGLLTGKIFLKTVLGHAFQITEAGWRGLTIRWIVFFVVMAGANEAIWRNVSTDMWVNWKVFGQLGLTFLFLLVQVPLLQKHQLEPEPEAEG